MWGKIDRASIKRLKKYYPKDMTFCISGGGCPVICPRKISDYEARLINYECAWAEFKGTKECKLTK